MREGWGPREAVREAQSPWVGKPSVDFGDCELGGPTDACVERKRRLEKVSTVRVESGRHPSYELRMRSD